MISDQPLALPSFECPSCGAESVGNFCSNCGERRLGSDDRSLRHYFDMAIDFLTHFDTKGYRSLRYLLTRPGFLSVEQLRGSRVPYAKPLSLFISINVVYYLSIAIFGANTFTTPLSVQLHQNDYYSGLASRQVERRIQADKTSFAALETKYNERTSTLSKTLIFLFIPIYATIFYALFFMHRRYLVEHAVVATHLWSFVLLLLAVVVPALAVLVMWLSSAPSIAAVLDANDNLISIFLQLCIAAYLILMLRRVYAASYWYCIVVSAVVAWAFFQIVWLYRFFLFLITLHSL